MRNSKFLFCSKLVNCVCCGCLYQIIAIYIDVQCGQLVMACAIGGLLRECVIYYSLLFLFGFVYLPIYLNHFQYLVFIYMFMCVLTIFFDGVNSSIRAVYTLENRSLNFVTIFRLKKAWSYSTNKYSSMMIVNENVLCFEKS